MNMRFDAWQRMIDQGQATVLLQPIAMLADQWSTADQVRPLAEPVLEMLLANIMAGLPATYAYMRSDASGKQHPAKKKSTLRKPRSKPGKSNVN
jgi:hypothetical protein